MRDRLEDESWVGIGFRFGLGFWAAGAVFSAVGSVIAWYVFTHDFSTAVSRASEVMREEARPVQQRMSPHRPVDVEVPPRSMEACKALTGGQINEDFARCRRGYTEQR